MRLFAPRSWLYFNHLPWEDLLRGDTLKFRLIMFIAYFGTFNFSSIIYYICMRQKVRVFYV